MSSRERRDNSECTRYSFFINLYMDHSCNILFQMYNPTKDERLMYYNVITATKNSRIVIIAIRLLGNLETGEDRRCGDKEA